MSRSTSKAFNLLKAKKSTEDRASQYAERVSESIKANKIVVLRERIGKLDDKIYDLENFSLETDINAGHHQISKENIDVYFDSIKPNETFDAFIEVVKDMKYERTNVLVRFIDVENKYEFLA